MKHKIIVMESNFLKRNCCSCNEKIPINNEFHFLHRVDIMELTGSLTYICFDCADKDDGVLARRLGHMVLTFKEL